MSSIICRSPKSINICGIRSRLRQVVNTFHPRLRLACFRGTADNSLKKLLSGLCVRCNGGIPSGPESPIPDGHDKNRRLQ
jgi:hypothetical protein